MRQLLYVNVLRSGCAVDAGDCESQPQASSTDDTVVTLSLQQQVEEAVCQ